MGSISLPSSPNLQSMSNDCDSKSTCSEEGIKSFTLDDKHKPKIIKKKKKRCATCKRKLKPFEIIPCRCGGLYCKSHKMAFDHNCPIDNFTRIQKGLVKANPKLKNDDDRLVNCYLMMYNDCETILTITQKY